MVLVKNEVSVLFMYIYELLAYCETLYRTSRQQGGGGYKTPRPRVIIINYYS